MRYALVPINALFFLLLAPLFEGVIRRITARVQSRKGPPLLQPYFDVLKLLGKENMDPAGTWAYRIAPVLAFASILAVAAILPVGGRETALTRRADAVTLVYLLTLGGVPVLLGALSSRNTFASIGASREMITMILVEPVLAMILLLGVIEHRSLDLAAILTAPSPVAWGVSAALMALVVLLALQAFVARQPFDIPEAEVEILGGPLIEYSGPNLALFKYYLMMKQMFYAYLPVALFVPRTGTRVFPLDLLVQAAATGIVFVLIGLLASTNPRFRIDQAVRYYAALILLSLCAVGIRLGGY
jgi:formate hydrogenlyase subunit 4